jgi:hypothetical protein
MKGCLPGRCFYGQLDKAIPIAVPARSPPDLMLICQVILQASGYMAAAAALEVNKHVLIG